MSATQQLHDLGQSLWLDNISRELLSSDTLSRYIKDFAVTGLTSNPTIFEQAIKMGTLMTRPSAKKHLKENPVRLCSLNWRWKI